MGFGTINKKQFITMDKNPAKERLNIDWEKIENLIQVLTS